MLNYGNQKPLSEQSRSEIVAATIAFIVIGGTVLIAFVIAARRGKSFCWIGAVFAATMILWKLMESAGELWRRKRGQSTAAHAELVVAICRLVVWALHNFLLSHDDRGRCPHYR